MLRDSGNLPGNVEVDNLSSLTGLELLCIHQRKNAEKYPALHEKHVDLYSS